MVEFDEPELDFLLLGFCDKPGEENLFSIVVVVILNLKNYK